MKREAIARYDLKSPASLCTEPLSNAEIITFAQPADEGGSACWRSCPKQSP